MKKGYGFFLFFLLGNLLFILVNIPQYKALVNSPANTFYPFIHQGHMDYYAYLSLIRESISGSWIARTLFTNEPTNSSLFYVYFIVLGKFGYLLGLDPIVTYHLGRVISIEFLLMSSYLVCIKVLGRKWGFWAGTVALFSTVSPVMFSPNIFWFLNIPDWWNQIDAFGRMDYLPHHAFGIACLFLTVYFIFSYKEKLGKRDFWGGIVFAFIGAFVFPPVGVILVIVLGSYIALRIVSSRANPELVEGERGDPVGISKFITGLFRLTPRNDMYWFIISVILSSFFALLLMKLQMQFLGFPWSQWTYWEMGLWNNIPQVNLRIIFAGGITLVFSLPIIIYYLWKSNSFVQIFLSLWAILPFIMLPFTDILGISKIRMAFMGSFLPLAILSVETVRLIAGKMQKPILKKSIYFCALFFFFLTSIAVSYRYFLHRYQSIPVGYLNTHIPVAVMDSMSFMKKNIRPYSVILSGDYVGGIFPAFVPVKSYYGHVVLTKDYGKKTPIVEKFFAGGMEAKEAQSFLKNGNIDYIYEGPKEKYLNIDYAKKYQIPFEKVYEEGGVEIYRIVD